MSVAHVQSTLFSAPPERQPPPPGDFTREVYALHCNQRWGGPALADAKRNWTHFQSIHAQLVEAMRAYRRDPFQEDVVGRKHNADGTLTAFLWNLQTALAPAESSLFPLLDFEEHFQRVFLRRGLLIYCSMLLREIEAKEAA